MGEKEEKKENEPTIEEIQKGNEIFEKLLNGEDVTDQVETERGVFTIKYPTNEDDLEIARVKSRMLKDIDLEKTDTETLILIEAQACIDVCLVGFPDWWKGSEKCPDKFLLGVLYRGFLWHTQEIRKLLRCSEVGRVVDEGVSKKSSKPVGGGTFPRFAKR